MLSSTSMGKHIVTLSILSPILMSIITLTNLTKFLSIMLQATPRLQDSGRVILELPDPRLKGNFPEEEMYIMAYLAKECLLLDPDSRPTMTEVVQILSTIAPDKSRMRNMQASLSQVMTPVKIAWI